MKYLKKFEHSEEKSKLTKLTLYHGTCSENAEKLVNSGWEPRVTGYGANMGNPKYLYLSNEPLDALWFANSRGCDSVVQLTDVPIELLSPDPEDEAGYSMQDLLNRSWGPSKFILKGKLGSEYFKNYNI